MEFGDKVFVTGIGTDVGKSMVSRELCLHFNLPYWKPVQCGDLEIGGDTARMKAAGIKCHPEAFRLNDPLSPHHATKNDGVKVSWDKIQIPEGKLIIEGAGGIMVPVNFQNETYADFAIMHSLPTILVIRHYLGSINHTQLSLELCKQKGIDLKGVIISGNRYEEAEALLNVPIIGHLPEQGLSENDTFVWYGLDK